MPAKPMLDGVELEYVQQVEAEDQEVLAQHGVPALEGDFLQDLGRSVTRVSLACVIAGPTAGDQLKTLREKFRGAVPVPFVADITTATKVDKVLIEEFGVRELAGKPDRFEYELTLREFIPPPPPQEEAPAPVVDVDEETQADAEEINAEQIEQIANDTGTLEVRVETADGGELTGVRIVVEGETSEGEPVSTFSDQQTDGVYRFTGLQAGTYNVRLELQ
jgi:DNA circularisation protein N-terminus